MHYYYYLCIVSVPLLAMAEVNRSAVSAVASFSAGSINAILKKYIIRCRSQSFHREH